MGDGEVVELLKIAKGHLPRVRLEYDRVKDELNSCKVDLNNVVRIYQQFVDRNIEMNKRINELQKTIDELDARKAELQKTRLIEPQSELQENNAYNDNLNLEVKHEDIVPTNGVTIPTSNMEIDHLLNENETL